MQERCEQIEKLLVDYADGQLPTRETSEVAEHLAKCERCRTTLKALQRSLDLARVIWAHGLEETRAVRISKTQRARRFQWRRYAAIAASILILAAVSVTWRRMTKPKEAEPTFAEIEHRIEQAGSAARLLAAAELLSEYPDCRSILKQQYRYIIDTYPQTPAAAKAKLRIEQFFRKEI
jgi:anti-sigma factor RsiW